MRDISARNVVARSICARSICARNVLAALVFAAAPRAVSGAEAEAQPALRLSIEDCVRMALRNSEEVRSAELGVTAAEGRVEEARSAVFPQVEASAGYTWQSGFGAAFGFDFTFPGLDTSNYYNASLMLSQVIYQAEVRYGLKAARLAVEQAEISKGLAHVGIAYGVRAAYAAALVQEAFWGAAVESVGLAHRQLADVQAKRRAGTVTDFEVLQESVQLRNAQALEIKARSGARLGLTRLLRVLGLDQGIDVELTDRLTYKPDELPPLEGLLARAAGEGGSRPPARVELRVMDKAIDLQRISVAVATAGRKPSVFARAGYVGGGFKDWFHEDFLVDAQASVTLSWTLFDGFRARGKRTQAMAQLEQLRLKRSSLVRDIEYEIRSALSRVRTARESVESQTETVGQAREAVRQAQVRYENGFVTELVVERARLGLAQVRTGLAQAKFDHFMAALDLRKAAGTLEVRPPAEDATTEPVR